MRRPIIAGNWKMNGTPTEATILVEDILQGLTTKDVDVVVCPPFTALTTVLDLADETDLQVGAQTMDYHESGAFTGEISAPMLAEMGVQYVIIGHSERRAYYGETDETVHQKLVTAFHHGLTPILCVGETLAQREANQTVDVIDEQLEKALTGIGEEHLMNLIIAYEPIWAIGTGKTATNEQAEEVCAHIRQFVTSHFGSALGEAVRIQYGGSVKPDNARQLLAQPNIDGALVGGASLKSADFLAIVQE